jgi:hypothetical protein
MYWRKITPKSARPKCLYCDRTAVWQPVTARPQHPWYESQPPSTPTISVCDVHASEVSYCHIKGLLRTLETEDTKAKQTAQAAISQGGFSAVHYIARAMLDSRVSLVKPALEALTNIANVVDALLSTNQRTRSENVVANLFLRAARMSLDSPFSDIRSSAMTLLEVLGKGASHESIRLLKWACRSHDHELQARARQILQQIEQRLRDETVAQYAYRPSPSSIDDKVKRGGPFFMS